MPAIWELRYLNSEDRKRQIISIDNFQNFKNKVLFITWMNEWMNLHFGPCRPLSMSSRYFLFLLSSSRSKANQQRSLVPFRLLQNLWHRGLQNVLLENIPCFSILRKSLNGRLFHGYLRTSSGFWRRQLKSNIGFLVLTKTTYFYFFQT